MQSQNRLFDDLARVASGALGVASGMRSEVEARLREQFERILSQMDLVTREEHEVVQAMAQRAREEQEELAAKVETLEARLAELEQKQQRTKTGGGQRKSTSRTRSSASGTGGGTGNAASPGAGEKG